MPSRHQTKKESNLSRKITIPALASVLVSTGLTAAACGGGTSLNLTCSSFLAKSGGDQRSIAQTYLEKVVGEKNPGTFSTFAAEGGLKLYCNSHPDDRVDQISI